ncbi:MAG: RNA polymerase sigma factor [Proteobacteria bacterium]|nr:RNA polymerase sigma factor [Pseudomonadota bacterium]
MSEDQTRPPTAPPSGASVLVALYLEKRADLVRFFTARTGSAAEAEDIVQDMYLKVSRAEGADVSNGVAWLYRLGSNVLLDRVRGAQRSGRRDAEWRGVTAVQVGGEEVEDVPPAEAGIDARRRLAALIAALDQLPPQARRVFTLHKLDGLSHAEVAARLGISRSAVEKHVMAALKRLSALAPANPTGGTSSSAASLGRTGPSEDLGGDAER